MRLAGEIACGKKPLSNNEKKFHVKWNMAFFKNVVENPLDYP